MDQLPLITFVGVIALVFGAYWLLVGQPESGEQAQLRQRLKADRQPTKLDRPVAILKEQQKFSSIPGLNSVLAGTGAFAQSVQALLDSAGIEQFTASTFLLLTATCILAATVVVNLLLHILWAALVVGVIAGVVPYLVVSVLRSLRIRRFEEQFPEAVELIARSMRAGHAFTSGIRTAAEELPTPAGPEFKLLYERQNFGAPLPDALRAFADRVPTIDARFFVTAVLTQREVGGNLAEILDRLASVMRQRFRIRREVQTKSAHGRMTAYVLAAMPPVLAILMAFINPEQIRTLLSDPLGLRILGGAAVLQVLGILVVRRIVDIKY